MSKVCAVAALVLALSAGATVSQPALVSVSKEHDKWILTAAPYVETALSRPIDQLYAAGSQAAPYDVMTIGLALLAGRSTDGNFSADDRAALLRLEERLAPVVDTYQIKHPEKNILRINWRRKLKITDAEKDLIDRYQRAYLPDYWLARALVATKTTTLTKNYRATTSDIGRGMAPGVSMTSDVYYDRIIPLEVIFTGAQCVAALREEAGLPLQPLHDHPISSWSAAAITYSILRRGWRIRQIPGRSRDRLARRHAVRQNNLTPVLPGLRPRQRNNAYPFGCALA
jgi:hypothetical protein